MIWGAVAPPSYAVVARPIAKRRAELLGWVVSANGGIDSLVLASGLLSSAIRSRLLPFLGSDSGCQKSRSKAADRSVRSTQTRHARHSPRASGGFFCG